MNERENEAGLQAQRTRPADARLQVGKSLPLQPSLTITAAKQPTHLKSARLIWALAVLGTLIGFFATTLETSEKPFAEQYEWLGVGIGRGNKFIVGIERTTTIRHFGQRVLDIRSTQITDLGDRYCWDETLHQAVPPTLDRRDRMNRAMAQAASQRAWGCRIALTLSWAGSGVLLGLLANCRL